MADKTIPSDASIWPQDNSKTMVCDGRIASQIVEDFGVNVKLREVTKTGFNEYGDPVESYTDIFIKAYIHQWTMNDDAVKEGLYKDGEIMFVFRKEDEAKVLPGNRLFYQSLWYKVVRVQPQMMSGRAYLVNATVAIIQSN
jgi:hypothetical protein